ncbi:MAG: hypothetical protein C4334_01395 [Pyrinomonas sp.]
MLSQPFVQFFFDQLGAPVLRASRAQVISAAASDVSQLARFPSEGLFPVTADCFSSIVQLPPLDGSGAQCDEHRGRTAFFGSNRSLN